MKKILLVLFSVLLLAYAALRWGPIRTALIGPGKYAGPALPPSTLAVPHERTIAWKSDSALAREVFAGWGDRSLAEVKRGGKSSGTRILLGHLLSGKQVTETNQLILSLTPWGVAGTSGWENPKGDYDFDETVYATMLWTLEHRPEILTPAAQDHILNVMLTEEGNAFRTVAPNTLGLFEETENHLLMTEGSRYLKNRWKSQHGDASPKYDNVANGMEARLLDLLGKMGTAGFHEFNSQPYIAYTILGLSNLEAFASDQVREAARNDLDYLNWSYALGSYRLRHFAPFRRRYEYAGMTSLTAGYQTAYMTTWLSFAPQPLEMPELEKGGLSHAIIAACLPYRPADAVVRTLFDKGAGYFVKLGHGEGASPEIFSAGPHFVLSAGGVNRGERTILVALPIVLLTDGKAKSLDEVFHLAGPGTSFRDWNDTGVYKNFAVAAGPVHVPAGTKAVAQDATWTIYAPARGLLLAVHSTPQASVLAVFEGSDPADLLTAVAKANPSEPALAGAFQFPGGHRLTYDLASPKDTWVMMSDGDTALNRAFDRWPLLSGEY